MKRRSDSIKKSAEISEPKKCKEVEDVKDQGAAASTSGAASASGGSSEDDDDSKEIYQVKWVGWNETRCPIVTQKWNGPCPLLSMVNVLLLRGKMSLPEGCEVVSSQQLLESLADIILGSVPSTLSNSSRLNYEQNINDAIAILPKLQTGLDVNVKFTGVSQFEYTPATVTFDLLNISLYHGWLMEPEQVEVCNAVGGLSYNQLVEKIITDKSSDDSAKVRTKTTF